MWFMLFSLYMLVKKSFWICLLWLGSLFSLSSKTEVLIKVDGVETSLSEFMYHYDRVRCFRNCSPEDYFKYFLRYKMKVADARNRGLVSGNDYLEEKELIGHYLKGKSDNVNISGGRVKLAILTYRLSQRSSDAYYRNAEKIMNGIYGKLISGTSLDYVVSEFKDSCIVLLDSGNKWMDRVFLPDEINTVIDKMNIGGISAPLYSPEGIHILQLKDIVYPGLTSDDGSTGFEDFILRQAEEALLVSAWDKNTRLEYSECTEESLERYFKSNRKKYKWEFPHYKGIVLHCEDKKTASRLKRKLRKQPFENWETVISQFCDETGEKLKYDIGLFEIGKNPYVDKIAFKCGDFKKVDGLPYSTLIGKRLDYEPENYKDVYSNVVNDYIREAEDRFFGDLEKKLKVEKHTDVLKTVNCSGSN